MEQNKQGGKREGAGRKPTDNPKKAVTIYVAKKKIYPFGNEEKLKGKIYEFIDGFSVAKETPPLSLRTELEETRGIVDTVKPLSFKAPKSAAQYLELKRECETADQWKELWEEINSSHLSFKEKQILKTAT